MNMHTVNLNKILDKRDRSIELAIAVRAELAKMCQPDV